MVSTSHTNVGHESTDIGALFAPRNAQPTTLLERPNRGGKARLEFDRSDFPRDELTASRPTRRTGEWTIAEVESQMREENWSAEDRLSGTFLLFDALLNQADDEARTFIYVLTQIGSGRVVAAAGAEMINRFRELIHTFADEAGLEDVEDLVLSWQILMRGTLARALIGDRDAAIRAEEMAKDLIVRHRRPPHQSHRTVETFDVRMISQQNDEDKAGDIDLDLLFIDSPVAALTGYAITREMWVRHHTSAIAEQRDPLRPETAPTTLLPPDNLL